MRYLCLIYDDEKKVGTMSQSESDKFMGEYFAFTEDIRKSGHMVHGEALQRCRPPPPSGCGTAS